MWSYLIGRDGAGEVGLKPASPGYRVECDEKHVSLHLYVLYRNLLRESYANDQS